MKATPQLKYSVEKADEEPVRFKDLGTRTAYWIGRKDVFRRMYGQTATVRADRSMDECGAFHADQ